MICPICEKRKAVRLCPAKAQSICTICCATEREVTIDCPSDCEYLIASRRYDDRREEVDWSTLPFPDVKVHPSWLEEHRQLLDVLAFAICEYAGAHPAIVDSDVISAAKSLAESYRTLTSGLYYENPPGQGERQELYDALKSAIATYRRETERIVGSGVRDSEVRDGLIAFVQIGHLQTNHRPKGRAFLDFLRRQFPEQEFGKPQSRIVLLP